MPETFILIVGFAVCGLGALWIICMMSVTAYKHVLLAIVDAASHVHSARQEAEIREMVK